MFKFCFFYVLLKEKAIGRWQEAVGRSEEVTE